MWLGHVNGSSHLRIFELGVWLLMKHVFARVKNVVNLMALTVCSMRSTPLFYLAILSPLICWFGHI